MTDTEASTRPTGQLSAVARLSGLSLDEVYRRFRMEGAPSPTDHVACVPVYDLEAAVAWLLPPSGGNVAAQESLDIAPRPPAPAVAPV